MNLNLLLIILLASTSLSQAVVSNPGKIEIPNYQNNRYPLVQKPYMELPLGTIKAKGWLNEMLVRQKNGASGQMDLLYPQVMGERNGWLGGDGDQWERGPYWIDGLLPLAYILDDKELQKKVQPWVEWALNSQKANGFFGPDKDYPNEKGIQRDNAHDWWPRMVVLKILQQYYSATGDKRVIDFMSKYFKYQLDTLPEKQLGNWTFWARYRAGDNLEVIYWLYNITGEPFLIDLGKIIHTQAHDFTHMFCCTDDLKKFNTIHCVNLAQGIKEPGIYYQYTGNQAQLKTLKKGFADLKMFNGQVQGMYGGDEGLHGNNPTQGVELCSIVELMFSLEKLMGITGDMDYMEHLEKIAFNALPTQITDDFMYKQYFQQANQVKITRSNRNFYEEPHHQGTDVVFGTLSGYPCCYSNMHQGWPKFVQSLWHATPDAGLAALIYSPSEVTAKVADGVMVKITEETFYPMNDKVRFTLNIENKQIKSVHFPFHVRIPSWCKEATISINGQSFKTTQGGTVEVIRRIWSSGDVVDLHFPMSIQVDDNWYEKSISVQRGPLVYALRISEKWEKKQFSDEEKQKYGKYYWEVTPETPWNYGILQFDKAKTVEAFTVLINDEKLKSNFYWNQEKAPIEIKVKAKIIPNWQLYGDRAGPIPFSTGYWGNQPVEEVTLIPYGCTTLRISQFPTVR